MSQSCLAVDIGASSGRVMLGQLANEQLQLDEIHRFKNEMMEKNGHFCWDIETLFSEIKAGLKKCRDFDSKPVSIGIDTWAVDFVLLDENDQLITDAVAYRDPRTDGMMEEVTEIIKKERLYLDTGIQFQKFNTIYQLYALKKQQPELLEKAKTFLMIPDYFHFLLTGKKANEYTNATTTQLVNAFTKKWDKELVDALGLPFNIFQPIILPKEKLGSLKEELVEELGFSLDVYVPATHDTGSAVLAVPENNETIYISSGTWSLIGIENSFPICITKALDYNFTNEGGVDYRFRFLKNIMGLWMIQEVKRLYDDAYSFAELVQLSKQYSSFTSILNVDDQRFLKPDDMIKEIQAYCKETKQQVPHQPGEVAKCVFDSLAESYQKAIVEIEEMIEKEYETIHVIGGGSQNEQLNQLIADKTKKIVSAGPVEATAIGNVVAQLMALRELNEITDARKVIANSFELKRYRAMTSIEEGME
ncbi:rhamnulokinase [Halalkalibacter sp. APA_J-10(15)]|uniref:rhamnulokinase n=1 Tax=Halalkalibacter sp. APA_J-10(15) TaxID=2933805 RepID=UPI001FF180BC|nr:rhamnulokinase [Halalkalibacter sp. APA_J-10(15)]MCK0472912.1 rhamnulokinase [Halalkalibacter sp. APA_J-10(15)]